MVAYSFNKRFIHPILVGLGLPVFEHDDGKTLVSKKVLAELVHARPAGSRISISIADLIYAQAHACCQAVIYAGDPGQCV